MKSVCTEYYESVSGSRREGDIAQTLPLENSNLFISQIYIKLSKMGSNLPLPPASTIPCPDKQNYTLVPTS